MILSKITLLISPFFGNFLAFLTNYAANSQDKCAIAKPGLWNFFGFTDYDLLFAEKQLLIAEIQVFEVLTFFINFLNLLKTYPFKSEMKGSIERMGGEIFFCRSGDA